MTDRKNWLQKHLKEAMYRRCRNFLSTDWLPVEKAKSFQLQDYYVEGTWLKHVNTARRFHKDKMEDLQEVFKDIKRIGPINILAIGMFNIWAVFHLLFILKKLFIRTFYSFYTHGNTSRVPCNIILLKHISGKAGTGKSCCMAMLALDWAQLEVAKKSSYSQQSHRLNEFDYVFLIQFVPCERQFNFGKDCIYAAWSEE